VSTFEQTRVASPVRSSSIAVTFLILAAIVVPIALLPNLGIVALTAGFVVVFVAFQRLRPQHERGGLLEVIVPYSVLNFLYFGVGTLYLVLYPGALRYQSLRPYLVPAVALGLLGYLCFLVGYGWFFRATPPSRLGTLEPSGVLIYLVPAVVGAVGYGAHRFQIASISAGAGISPGVSFIQQFGTLFLFAWYLGWYMRWAGRLRGVSTAFVLGGLGSTAACIMFLSVGTKALAITIAGMPLVAYYDVRRKLPWKTVMVLGLIAVFVIFPMYNTYRLVGRSLDTVDRVDRTVEVASRWDGNEYLEASVFAFLRRMTLAVPLAAIISDTGRWVDYRYGETLILAPIGLLIPRILWPDKPNISIGREFGTTFRLIRQGDYETEVALSMVGDFYWNFALPGAVIGMLLVGMGYRWYYQRYGAGTGYDPVRRAVYATVLPSALLFEGNVAIVIAGIIKQLVIVTLLLAVAHRIGWLREKETA